MELYVVLDSLDKKIIQQLSLGASSYEELARQCNVTRNTIYRRISALEEAGVIKNMLHCIINMEQLEISAVTIGARVPQLNQDKAFTLLALNKDVRFLWRTYGDYNLTLIAFCTKGREGEFIHSIRMVLEGMQAHPICVSVGFMWEKISYSPFGDYAEGKEEQTQPMLETQINLQSRKVKAV
jgi:DNA-binding Lrp family transcriptional regulator